MAKIVEVRNVLAHHPNKVLDQDEFDSHWNKLSSALIALGFPENKIEEFYSAERIGGMNLVNQKAFNPASIAAANQLNDDGNEAFRKNKIQEAVQFYTQALELPDLSDELLGILYCNRSTAYLKLKPAKIQEATDDAKQTISCRPTWWKSYFRLGLAYEAKRKLEKAVVAFNNALGLDPSQLEVRSARDGCRETIAILRCKEHLDPTTMPMSRDEYIEKLRERSGGFNYLTAKQVGENMAFYRKSGNPKLVAEADVYLAHHYLTGMDDVKQDYEQAARLFAKAAAAGNAEAIYNLAILTKSGQGVERDIPLALTLLHRAAALPPIEMGLTNLGVAEAEHCLGLCYEEGIGVDPDFKEAFKWYERGSAHGCSGSSNNLGCLYSNGQGVPQDLQRAMQYWKLAAYKGNVLAMQSLECHYLTVMDFKQAKHWALCAQRNGSIVNSTTALEDFYGELPGVEKPVVPPELEECFQDIVSIMQSVDAKLLPTGNKAFSSNIDYKSLMQSAENGSATAQILRKAFQQFSYGLKLYFSRNFVADSEVVHEFAEVYRTEHIAARWPNALRVKFIKFLESNLTNLASKQPTDFELDLRICYAYLRGNAEKMVAFIKQSMKRYPCELCFHDVLGSMFGFLERYDEGLECTIKALKIFPNNIELLYNKAGHLRLSSATRENESIEAYEEFLKSAPTDHRKVPESYYGISLCYFSLSQRLKEHEDEYINSVKNYFQLGLDAESNQLSCFLPYNSTKKQLLENVLKISNFVSAKNSKPPSTECINDGLSTKKTGALNFNTTKPDMIGLSDPYRVQLTLFHRENSKIWIKKKLENNLSDFTITQGKSQQTAPTKLTRLKPITFREMDPTYDHVYEGFVLQVLSIEDAIEGGPSAALILMDENKDFQRCFVYKIPQDQIQETLGFACSFSILNPHMRMAEDQKPGIRVDDPRSLIFHTEPLPSDQTPRMCRFCFSENTNLLSCSRCKRAKYCSIECQFQDWNLLNHKRICSKHKK